MIFIIFIAHILIDFLFGYGLLLLLNRKTINLSFVAESIGIGMFFDTLILAILNYIGISLNVGFLIFSLLSLGLMGYTWFRIERPTWQGELFKKRLSILEWFFTILIGEKLVWNILNLINIPTYFDDALNHWSGKARALAFNINWSWDPSSVYFLGKPFGHVEYPLFLNVWRATNFNLGDPMSHTDRWDGLIIWLIISIILFTWITQLTQKRVLGFVGVFILSALPIQSWHISAGYAEIMIQCFFLLSLWSIYNQRMVVAGIFTAAMIWSKNEGLIIFMPLVTSMLFLVLIQQETKLKQKAITFFKYQITWLLCMAPWLVFKLVHGVGLTIPGERGIYYRERGLFQMAKALFDTPSSSIFWIVMLLVLIIGTIKIKRSSFLRTIVPICWISLAMMTFVFTCTNAHIFLSNQMTIHRSLLQIAPIFVIAFCYVIKNFDNKKAQV